MKIVSLNLNGIRAAARKGLFEWISRTSPDVLCFQETKAQQHQLADELFHPSGYFNYFHDALKKGYSGVAIYTRHQPEKVIKGLGWTDVDSEGRWIQADYDKLSVISLYLPSGTSGDIRQSFKYDVMARLEPVLKKMRQQHREIIICGDWNIAHKKIDIKNWRSNQKNSGFLPEERAWLDWVFDEAGYVDTFRILDQAENQYTWWSNRGQAWANNTGWRIDYHITTPKIAETARSVQIYKDERFSDHAPLTIEYDFSF